MIAPQLTALASLALLSAPAAFAAPQTQLTVGDPALWGVFGRSTDLDGDSVVVGSPGAQTGGVETGAAYVFDRGTASQVLRLLPGQEGGEFGEAVAMEGNRIFVSAYLANDIGPTPATFFTRAGAVYAFDATTGQQLMKLTASDIGPHVHFGRSLALDGGLLAVGARAATSPGVEPDAVYVIDAATGQELHKLFAADGQDEDRLGESVAIDDGLLVAGAAGDDDNGDRSGSAYVFDAATGAQLAKLLPLDGDVRDGFGTSVAISGNDVIIGAHRNDDNGTDSGAAYVFDATTGQQLMKLLPDDGQPNDLFGQTVAIDGGRVVVGAPQSDDMGSSSGSIYVFDLATGQQLEKHTASNGGTQHYFGYSLAIQRDTVAIGAPFAEFTAASQGAAYLLDLAGGPEGVVSFCDPLTANSVSSTGALLVNTGGFGTDAATFNVSDVPNGFGLLFSGDASVNVALGCGARCVGGNIIRGPVLLAENNKILGATFDMAQFGSTHIQYWFRDIGTCGSGSNLSNALTR